jgi:rhodanese-related sulfurtransferase
MSNKLNIIDVRTPAEFELGHVQGSTNIPLNEIPTRINELKAMPQPIVFCCASGMRSGQATIFLQQQGINCTNGGSWLNLN